MKRSEMANVVLRELFLRNTASFSSFAKATADKQVSGLYTTCFYTCMF